MFFNDMQNTHNNTMNSPHYVEEINEQRTSNKYEPLR